MLCRLGGLCKVEDFSFRRGDAKERGGRGVDEAKGFLCLSIGGLNHYSNARLPLDCPAAPLNRRLLQAPTDSIILKIHPPSGNSRAEIAVLVSHQWALSRTEF